MHNRIKQGFTLAELMAVVIIVALLAVLGTGYYKRAVEQSRFSEGLMAASAIVEGINRAVFEQQMRGSNLVIIPQLNQLDIGITGGCTMASCTTRYFNIAVEKEPENPNRGMVTATRRDGTYSDVYRIQIRPHFVINESQRKLRDRIECVGINDNGKTFCESMGYTSCTDDRVCVKPN